jgi:hypothetical protein
VVSRPIRHSLMLSFVYIEKPCLHRQGLRERRVFIKYSTQSRIVKDRMHRISLTNRGFGLIMPLLER